MRSLIRWWLTSDTMYQISLAFWLAPIVVIVVSIVMDVFGLR